MAAKKKKTAPKKTAKKKSSAKAAAKSTAKKATAMERRADFGKPIDAYIAKQTPEQRAILEALRGLIEAAMPKATSAIKWGMPVFEVDGKMAAAMRARPSYVSLIMTGAPSAFKDPKGLLAEGTAKNMRQLKVESLAALPKKEVSTWLKIAARA